MTAKPNDRISGSLRMAWFVVICALITAIGFALDLAWARFGGLMFVICALGLTTIAVAEVLFWHQSASAWHERRPVAALLSATVAIACSAGTLYTNYSTSALGQDFKLSEKLSAFNASDDLDRSQKELSEKVSTLQKQLAAAPQRTSEAAQAAIDNAKAHKFWGVTDGCKETKGQQTRDFCAQYALAVADKSNASAAVQARADLANTQNELKGIREKRGSTEAVASKDNPAISMLVGRGFTEVDAHVIDSMMMPAVIQVIMALGGILLANEHARGKEPKPWLPHWLSNFFRSSATVAFTGQQLRSADDVYAEAAKTPAPPSTPLVRERRTLVDINAETMEEKRARQKREESAARLLELGNGGAA